MMLRNSCENKCVGNYGGLLSEAGGEARVAGERAELRGNKGRANPELVWLCLLLRPDKCQRAAVNEARMIAIY